MIPWNKGLKGFGKGEKLGERNGMWKGDDVGYNALHEYIKHHLPKEQTCAICKQPKSLDLANISGEYKRDLADWNWLCRKCHMISDGRLDGIHQRAYKDKQCVTCGKTFYRITGGMKTAKYCSQPCYWRSKVKNIK